jgi:Holliday junction DNA helicase RuvA
LIGRLTGRLLECTPAQVLLDVGGVGYRVQIPLSTFYELHDSRDAAVSLHVHTHVREDALQLYGFASEAEREAFVRFIGVSGVGPKLALAVLSGIGVRELEQAVLDGDRARLQRIPGVGRKTAERLLLELRDKLGVTAAEGSARANGQAPASGGAAAHAAGTLAGDTASALANLGFSRQAAEKAVAETLDERGPDVTLEVAIRESLARLVR